MLFTVQGVCDEEGNSLALWIVCAEATQKVVSDEAADTPELFFSLHCNSLYLGCSENFSCSGM